MSVEHDTDRVPLTVHAVHVDPKTDTQIVILRDDLHGDVLPIWVGATEGAAIRMALKDVVPPRPTSHDLLASFVTHLGMTVTHVVVTDVQHNTYYAKIHLSSGGGLQRTVDARPSDAIALSLRTACPIYVTRDVLSRRSGDNKDEWLAKLNQEASGQSETEAEAEA